MVGNMAQQGKVLSPRLSSIPETTWWEERRSSDLHMHYGMHVHTHTYTYKNFNFFIRKIWVCRTYQNLTILEVEIEGSEIQGHPQLAMWHFVTCLPYILKKSFKIFETSYISNEMDSTYITRPKNDGWGWCCLDGLGHQKVLTEENSQFWAQWRTFVIQVPWKAKGRRMASTIQDLPGL